MGIEKHENKAIRELLVEHNLSGEPQRMLESRQHKPQDRDTNTTTQRPADVQDGWCDRAVKVPVCLAHR